MKTVYMPNNFQLYELCATDTGLPNEPDETEIEKLTYLAHYILQPIRDKWGRIGVNSAFRSDGVNKAVGGVEDSDHPLGEAADIVPLDADIDEVFAWIVNESGIPYGQTILEENKAGSRWIHISLVRAFSVNLSAMTYKDGRYGLYKREVTS